MNHSEKRNSIDRSRYLLSGLCIYRNLLTDPVIAAYRFLLQATAKSPPLEAEAFIESYSDFYSRLSRANRGVDFSHYVFDGILLDENVFTLSAADPAGKMNAGVKAAACSDILALRFFLSNSSSMIKECFLEGVEDRGCRDIIRALPEWTALQAGQSMQTGPASGEGITEGITIEELWRLWSAGVSSENYVNQLENYHAANGSGLFARKYAFTWQHWNPDVSDGASGYGGIRNPEGAGRGYLAPVQNPDPVRLSDLIAYEPEREEVVKNTEQFLSGYQANNVLLYGDRGTGKSSTVKALLNEYAARGLRMIEVPKHLLVDFPKIIALLSGKPHKFILFVDDLSFEDSEDSYTALKAIIEGGLEVRPDNVLIYATSNRRHLVREKFSDRAGLQYGSREDEIRAVDTMQEKLSLSDRFGITVIFASPDKKRFLEIVDKLAQKKGISMEPETLHKEALKWELWYNGRSPRTAQQFINYICSEYTGNPGE